MGRTPLRPSWPQWRTCASLPAQASSQLSTAEIFAALERVSDHLPEPPPFTPRQRLWRVCRAPLTILAAGATERPLAFPDNDRPGIMLAGAARAYLNRFGVAVGRKVAIYTATDDGWLTARDLIEAGLAAGRRHRRAGEVAGRVRRRRKSGPGRRRRRGRRDAKAAEG